MRRKLARSSSASARPTSDRSCQSPSSSALNSASGGQAGSPFAAAWMPSSRPATCAQSTVSAIASSLPFRLRSPGTNPKLS